MNKYKFGRKSKQLLSTCHQDLIKIFNLAISRSKVDFGISEGHRTFERQQYLYAIGRTTEIHRKPVTNVNGITHKSKHQYEPSLAVDIFAYHHDRRDRMKIAYDREHLSYIAGVVDSCAIELYEKGETSHLIRWGGNWDSDGIIRFDQNFYDGPHFELIKP